jgi:hypothetical protein
MSKPTNSLASELQAGASISEVSSPTTQQQQKASNKMRIEFTIPPRMCKDVIETFETMNLQATIYESKTCGCKKQKYTIDINRGTGIREVDDSNRITLVSVVDSNLASGLVDLVRGVVGTDGSTVVLSEVHDLVRL